jgi:thioredoxin
MTSKCLKIHYYSPNTSVDLPRPLRSPYFVFSSSQQIKIVNEQELEVEVANRECPMIIDFFATWCGPCVLLAKELEQVAEELGDQIKIIKIDCDENEAISSALQIQGLPTLIFIGMDPQKPALRTEGLLPAQAIIDIVQKELLAPAADA